MRVTIRPAASDDLAAIDAIQGPSVWQPVDYLNYDCRVALEAGRIVGFLVSREVAPGEHEVLNLVVDSGLRRRGVARRLLQERLDGCPAEWFLEVRESNVAALNLYESMGFQPIGRREDYYPDPPEAAIVMRLFS